MMKITTTCFFLFLIVSVSTQAQTKATRKADSYFMQKDYGRALTAYSNVLGKVTDNRVLERLAYCHLYLHNDREAAKWFQKAIDKTRDPGVFCEYASLLKSMGQVEASNEIMRRFARAFPQDVRAVAFLAHPDYVNEIRNRAPHYEVSRLKINSNRSDFGAVLTGNQFYFTSARNANGKVFTQANEPFLDLYSSTLSATNELSLPTSLTDLNSDWNDGPLSFSADKKTLFFASESFRAGKGFRKQQTRYSAVWIFTSNYKDNKWTTPKPLVLTEEGYSAGNPSVSADGKTLYFSSDRPGGYGGLDIWKVALKGDGTLGVPENLGSRVNTPGDESFPFISDDNVTLSFASKGHPGLGGYDCFTIRLDVPSQAENVGIPVNSEKDDFSFSYDNDRKLGFVTSNRKGDDDIFKVTPLNQPIEATSEKETRIVTNVAPPEQAVAATDRRNETPTVMAETKKEIWFEVDSFALDRDDIGILDALILLVKSDARKIEINSYTDTRGSNRYNLALSFKRAIAVADYLRSKGIAESRIQYRGYGEESVKVDCGNDCTEQDHRANRRTEIVLVK